MSFYLQDEKKVAVVDVDGPLDYESAGAFKEKIHDLTEAGHPFFILNFENVDFVDSVGLGALLSALKKVRREGGDIRLCMLTKRVKSLFELTRLSNVFQFYETLEEAQADFPV